MLRQKAQPLAEGYRYQTDTVDQTQWNCLLSGFADANFNQTWAYAQTEEGRDNIGPFVLTRNGEVAALAMVRFKRVAALGIGLAYVHRGPLWRQGAHSNPEVFRQAIRALRNEFVCKRGLSLRLNPAVFDDDSFGLASVLAGEGFSRVRQQIPNRTIVMDLAPSLEALRHGLGRNWRRNLKLNEANNLEVVEGTERSLFEEFRVAYGQMIARKSLHVSEMFSQFEEIQSTMPDSLKLRIMLCRSGGTLCSGLIWSAMGDTGIALLAATSDAGMRAGGSHLLQWRLVEKLKQDGMQHYNLNGIDPIENPGTYRFKRELAGKSGRDVCYLGKFDASAGPLTESLIRLRDGYRVWKRRHVS